MILTRINKDVKLPTTKLMIRSWKRKEFLSHMMDLWHVQKSTTLGFGWLEWRNKDPRPLLERHTIARKATCTQPPKWEKVLWGDRQLTKRLLWEGQGIFTPVFLKTEGLNGEERLMNNPCAAGNSMREAKGQEHWDSQLRALVTSIGNQTADDVKCHREFGPISDTA